MDICNLKKIFVLCGVEEVATCTFVFQMNEVELLDPLETQKTSCKKPRKRKVDSLEK